jgi:vacuolar iron transporter family protein
MPFAVPRSIVRVQMTAQDHTRTEQLHAVAATRDAIGPPAVERLAGHYLPDLVYGANDGIITTFAVVSGVVGAALSERVIVILGLANLVADGFSMGASNYLARRSHAEQELAERGDAARHGLATILGFVVAGVIPLLAYLLPVDETAQFPAAIALAAAALFSVGAARSFVTRRGFVRSGVEMLLVGSLAAAVAFAIGAFASTFA